MNKLTIITYRVKPRKHQIEAKTKEERWRHFGQHDHVRMYSKASFITKLESAGFKVHKFSKDDFGVSDFERCGIHPRSVLYVVEK
jgi:hypothetical protein